MNQKDFSLQQTHLNFSKDYKSKNESGKTKNDMVQNYHWKYQSIWIARQHMNSKKSSQDLKNRSPGKIQFENLEDKEIFDETIDQAAKLATFGFGQAKFQDNDARDYATKTLKLPASMQYKGKFPEEDRAENTFDQGFMADLHQARFQQCLLYNNTNNNQQHGRPYGRGGYRGANRGYTRFNTRSFAGNFHQRRNSSGNRFTSPASNTNAPTDNNQQ
ncbi:hypothetical protein RO3G_00129 [Rhizopus delemar RA 99-880]|uniref:Uncharacterized protein n=1 Tax=Rhizopus delemar (strain RA 99-880 / ATCC MYA-4621 / FGSC 9543 / NRRL 43880) TaxID=246409 RepID=I1BGU5_RHIO9|nr:hypothetical protein RO3G_00129 [Rhizopus delemar RA 99-880]|eukprot:EIE75425.1 hypothetical protein RO3G_00129 [Rhizopus delemar RA 99-880]